MAAFSQNFLHPQQMQDVNNSNNINASASAAAAAAERAQRSVFVGNIPYDATEEQLKSVFKNVGEVASFRLVYDRETGKPKGYGFCEFKDVATAQSAMRNLNNTEFHGRPLRVGVAAGEQNKDEGKALQQALGGQVLESPYGEPVEPEKAPEAISKAVASLPPEQMFELMKQMKLCIQNNPNEARNMLLQNPQLAYALLQAQIVMKIVDPQVAMSMLYREESHPPLNISAPSNAPKMPGGPMMASMQRPGPPMGGVMNQPMGPMSQGGPPMQMPMGNMAPKPMPMPPHPDMRMLRPMGPRGGDGEPGRFPPNSMGLGGPPNSMGPGGPPNSMGPGGPPNSMGPSGPPMGPIGPPNSMGPGGPPNQMGPGGPPNSMGPGGPPTSMGPGGPPTSMGPGGLPMGAGGPTNPLGPQRMPGGSQGAGPSGGPTVQDQEKAALIMQVLQLTDEQIASLDPEQRQSIMILKEQIKTQ